MTKKNSIKTNKTIQREIFFDKGGTPKQWMKAKRIHPDRKKENNRKLCRQKIEE